jgi:hypothetical protein
VVRIVPYLDYGGDTSGCTKPELRVLVYDTVVNEPLSQLATIAANMEDHVREFEEACDRPVPTMVRPTKREQRRIWREQSAQRRKG